MVHNIDTLGADLDPALLGLAHRSGRGHDRRGDRRGIEDRGGGLARVDGRLRLVEGLALPSEEIEFAPLLLQHATYLDRHRPPARASSASTRDDSADDRRR